MKLCKAWDLDCHQTCIRPACSCIKASALLMLHILSKRPTGHLNPCAQAGITSTVGLAVHKKRQQSCGAQAQSAARIQTRILPFWPMSSFTNAHLPDALL